MPSDHDIDMSRPSAGEAGRTGDWRSKRPELVIAEQCSAVKQNAAVCQLCWVYCPDSCVSRGIGPEFDLEHCKGCGICAEVCPTDAIRMQPEAEHGVCELR
jgi:pyruvate ferredoxin oxidoreductase delta subunit